MQVSRSTRNVEKDRELSCCFSNGEMFFLQTEGTEGLKNGGVGRHRPLSNMERRRSVQSRVST